MSSPGMEVTFALHWYVQLSLCMMLYDINPTQVVTIPPLALFSLVRHLDEFCGFH